VGGERSRTRGTRPSGAPPRIRPETSGSRNRTCPGVAAWIRAKANTRLNLIVPGGAPRKRVARMQVIKGLSLEHPPPTPSAPPGATRLRLVRSDALPVPPARGCGRDRQQSFLRAHYRAAGGDDHRPDRQRPGAASGRDERFGTGVPRPESRVDGRNARCRSEHGGPAVGPRNGPRRAPLGSGPGVCPGSRRDPGVGPDPDG